MSGSPTPQWSFSQPDQEQVATFLQQQKEQKFSYKEVNQTYGAPPRGYDYDDNEIQIGEGDDDYTKAREALLAWRMFPTAWTKISVLDDEPIAQGTTIAMQARALGIWWMNACRVAYTIDEHEPVRRFGFAYGTLPAHVEQGEELFSIEQWADGTVWYRIQAFSRPRFWPVRMAQPIARLLQRKFVRDSQAAMVNLMRDA